MIRNRLITVFAAVLFAAVCQAQTPTTGAVYAVGSCKPSLPSYNTISAALAATPAPTMVQVCPGNYPEQVVITQAVTLQGVTSGGSGQAIVNFPLGGPVLQPTDDMGRSLGPILWVNNATGPVTISDLTFDGSNFLGGPYFGFVEGIFFQNSSGTLNRVTVRNQSVQFGGGLGVYLEGGAANPTVTVQNSSIHDIESWGIYAESATSGTSVTAVLKSNLVSANNTAIYLDLGSNSTVTNNIINGSGNGILTNPGATGTVSGNTTVASGTGIAAGADGVSITGNKIMGSSVTGIAVTTGAAAIQSNSIISAPVGIDFGCTSNASVSGNILSEIQTGLGNVPSGVTTNNTYFNVGAIRSAGACAKAH